MNTREDKTAIELPGSARMFNSWASSRRQYFYRAEMLRLVLLVIAASVALFSAVGKVSGSDLAIGPAIAGVLLLGAFVLDLAVKESEPRTEWLRAVELEKRIEALAWQYVVGGHKFSTLLPQD